MSFGAREDCRRAGGPRQATPAGEGRSEIGEDKREVCVSQAPSQPLSWKQGQQDQQGRRT